jgi:hypothetical protein
MPTVARIGPIQIRFYFGDHGIPHFHAISPVFDFKFAVSDCSVISGNGSMRGRDLAIIRTWAEKHRRELYLNWQRARDGDPLESIED